MAKREGNNKNFEDDDDEEDDDLDEEVDLMYQEGKMMNKFTKMCWDKCMQGTPGEKLSNSERNCIAKCAGRFVETQHFLFTKFLENPDPRIAPRQGY